MSDAISGSQQIAKRMCEFVKMYAKVWIDCSQKLMSAGMFFF